MLICQYKNINNFFLNLEGNLQQKYLYLKNRNIFLPDIHYILPRVTRYKYGYAERGLNGLL